MTGPRVPEHQADAFQMAMAQRLGLNAEEITDDFRARFRIDGDDEYARVTVSFTAVLPAEEVLEMFNNTAPRVSTPQVWADSLDLDEGDDL